MTLRGFKSPHPRHRIEIHHHFGGVFAYRPHTGTDIPIAWPDPPHRIHSILNRVPHYGRHGGGNTHKARCPKARASSIRCQKVVRLKSRNTVAHVAHGKAHAVRHQPWRGLLQNILAPVQDRPPKPLTVWYVRATIGAKIEPKQLSRDFRESPAEVKHTSVCKNERTGTQYYYEVDT